jgi:uncharacterized protein YllA (UPF0747 family)
MKDRKRNLFQELEAIIKNENRLLKKTIESYKDDFKFVSTKELLEKRKEKFDYKFTKLMNNYGISPDNIRDRLDRLWNNIKLNERAGAKYIRPLKYVPLVTLVANLYDNTEIVKEHVWSMYMDKIRKLANRLCEKS